MLERLTSHMSPLGDGIQGVMSGLPRDHLASEELGCDLQIPALETDKHWILAKKEGHRKSNEKQGLMKGQGCSHSLLSDGDLSTAFLMLGKH